MNLYNSDFYDQISDGALRSADIIVDEFLATFELEGQIKSVIDFGCGTGAWLRAFQDAGAEEIHGVDGSNEGHGMIKEEEFELWDLSQPYVPLHKYDLAISLEVAEHVPEAYADNFVANVARCSDIIIWSAAVPGQNGVNHVNEQWPSYWVPKFQELGYTCSANFRFDFWHDERIENWYRQNLLVFANDDGIDKITNYETLLSYFGSPQILDVVHYNNWMHKI